MSIKRSKKSKKINYLKLVGFSTPSEAYQMIKEWSSNLSDDQHLIRSVILDIHDGIELLLRQILYQYMKELVFQTGNKKEDRSKMKPFEEMINKLRFFDMYRILKPIFDSWPKPDLSHIQSIHDLRNEIAHTKSINKVSYKGRNPFTNPDAFAQLFFEAWAASQELTEFCQKAIEDPRAIAEFYYKEYQKCQKKHKSK